MPSKRSFDARFGAILRSHGIAAIPGSLFRYQSALGLSPQETWLVCVLLAYRWDEREPYPSLRTIAEQSGIARSSVQRYLAELKAKGLVAVTERLDADGRQTSNTFDLEGLFEALERYVRAEGEGRTGWPSTASRRIGDGRAGWPEVDPSETDSKEEEMFSRDLADRLGDRIAVALKQPTRGEEWARTLRDRGMSDAELERLVQRALAAWEVEHGLEALTEALEG